jgi:hypothetical protein
MKTKLRLKDKYDQVIYTSQMPIISDVIRVFSLNTGELQGKVNLNNKICSVINTGGFWKLEGV